MKTALPLLTLVFTVAATAAAQSSVTTRGGTAGTIPVYTSSTEVENSILSQNSGYLSVAGPLGTTGTITSGSEVLSLGAGAGFRVLGTPGDDVNGAPWYGVGMSSLNLWTGAQSAVQVAGFYGLNFQTAYGQLVLRGDNGNVGIGTTTPSQSLEVAKGNTRIWNAAGLGFPLTAFTLNSYLELSQHVTDPSGTGGGLARIGAYSNGKPGVDNYGQAAGLAFQTSSTDAVPTTKVVIDESGNVGIGTLTPGADLATLASPPLSTTTIFEVSGDIALTQGKGGQIYYPDGTVQSTAWNGVLSGGDYAESVSVSGDRQKYEPGDVLVIDPASEGNFLKSSAPYSTAVTGIYSTRPGVVGRRQHTARTYMNEEVPMAMTGIVPTKVSAENGPIKPGDLLVTSSKPGYAMKGTDRAQMLGAVIGKAIGHLDSGTGLIEAVVTLQ